MSRFSLSVFLLLAASLLVVGTSAGEYKAASYGPSPAQYPADLTPAECPNYPFCGPSPAVAEAKSASTSSSSSEAVTTVALQALGPKVTNNQAQAAGYTVVQPTAGLGLGSASAYQLIPATGYQAASFYSAPSANYVPYVYLAYPAAAAQQAQYSYVLSSAPAGTVQTVQQPEPAKPVAAPVAAPQEVPQLKFRKVALAPEYPAGVSPADCPNYPYCGAPGLTYARYQLEPVADDDVASPAVLPAADKYPASFDSSTCIDYPFCTQRQ